MIDITITHYFQLDQWISIATTYFFFLILHKTCTLSTRLSGTWPLDVVWTSGAVDADKCPDEVSSLLGSLLAAGDVKGHTLSVFASKIIIGHFLYHSGRATPCELSVSERGVEECPPAPHLMSSTSF